MSNRKRKQQEQRTRAGGTPAGRWTFGHIMIVVVGVGLALVLVVGLGGIVTDKLSGDRSAPAPAATEPAEPERQTDAYGRSPGHPHYGHPHP